MLHWGLRPSPQFGSHVMMSHDGKIAHMAGIYINYYMMWLKSKMLSLAIKYVRLNISQTSDIILHVNYVMQ